MKHEREAGPRTGHTPGPDQVTAGRPGAGPPQVVTRLPTRLYGSQADIAGSIPVTRSRRIHPAHRSCARRQSVTRWLRERTHRVRCGPSSLNLGLGDPWARAHSHVVQWTSPTGSPLTSAVTQSTRATPLT